MSERLRVGVFGAGGRMGSTVCSAVAAAPDLELVAAVDPFHGGIDLSQLGVPVMGLQVARSADALAEAGAEVAVDFTVIDAALENLRWCAEHDVHAVVGTTGFTDADIDDLEARFEQSRANAFIAPNFAIGAVLMMRFAAEASRHMERAEIVELHHPAKLDAPSGTAARTAEMMEGDVPIHSVRLPGLVADQEVILGDVAQTLTIRHVTTDRTSFMPGVLLAIRHVAELPESPVFGLEKLLWPSSP
jgi:4-hydroxy-tetrahydrodipicolinate reductase